MLASLGSKGEKRNSLDCLRNAGSYFAGSYLLYHRTTFPALDANSEFFDYALAISLVTMVTYSVVAGWQQIVAMYENRQLLLQFLGVRSLL